jgi:hypothetical protein
MAVLVKSWGIREALTKALDILGKLSADSRLNKAQQTEVNDFIAKANAIVSALRGDDTLPPLTRQALTDAIKSNLGMLSDIETKLNLEPSICYDAMDLLGDISDIGAKGETIFNSDLSKANASGIGISR